MEKNGCLALFIKKHIYDVFDSDVAVIKEKVKSAPAKKGKNIFKSVVNMSFDRIRAQARPRCRDGRQIVRVADI
jgi:hypothetical protein